MTLPLLFGQTDFFLSDIKQLFNGYFPDSVIGGTAFYIVIIVAVVLSGNVFSQYLMEASKVVTLCLLPGMFTFITARHTSDESQHDGTS